MLFSAGNDNINQVLWPGNMKESIAVGASDMCDTRKRPNDCSGENWWGSSYGNSLDLVAPGVKIATCDISGDSGYTTNDYSLTFNGTSAASPVAAGLVALYMEMNPTATSRQVKDWLKSRGTKLTNTYYDPNTDDTQTVYWTGAYNMRGAEKRILYDETATDTIPKITGVNISGISFKQS